MQKSPRQIQVTGLRVKATAPPPAPFRGSFIQLDNGSAPLPMECETALPGRDPSLHQTRCFRRELTSSKSCPDLLLFVSSALSAARYVLNKGLLVKSDNARPSTRHQSFPQPVWSVEKGDFDKMQINHIRSCTLTKPFTVKEIEKESRSGTRKRGNADCHGGHYWLGDCR